VFLDEAGNLKPLAARLNLENLRGSSAAPPARRVQEKILSNAKRLVSQNAAVPGNQLTGAKVSILKRLESALGNRKSAEAIFVSEGTLKWHLHNVYGKRDVKTPRAAAPGSRQPDSHRANRLRRRWLADSSPRSTRTTGDGRIGPPLLLAAMANCAHAFCPGIGEPKLVALLTFAISAQAGDDR
jgi:DNA-binding CsgD family transcriptional regulator